VVCGGGALGKGVVRGVQIYFFFVRVGHGVHINDHKMILQIVGRGLDKKEIFFKRMHAFRTNQPTTVDISFRSPLLCLPSLLTLVAHNFLSPCVLCLYVHSPTTKSPFASACAWFAMGRMCLGIAQLFSRPDQACPSGRGR
jgi:hypothetical protein